MYCIGQRKFVSLQQLVDHYQVDFEILIFKSIYSCLLFLPPMMGWMHTIMIPCTLHMLSICWKVFSSSRELQSTRRKRGRSYFWSNLWPNEPSEPVSQSWFWPQNFKKSKFAPNPITVWKATVQVELKLSLRGVSSKKWHTVQWLKLCNQNSVSFLFTKNMILFWTLKY